MGSQNSAPSAGRYISRVGFLVSSLFVGFVVVLALRIGRLEAEHQQQRLPILAAARDAIGVARQRGLDLAVDGEVDSMKVSFHLSILGDARPSASRVVVAAPTLGVSLEVHPRGRLAVEGAPRDVATLLLAAQEDLSDVDISLGDDRVVVEARVCDTPEDARRLVALGLSLARGVRVALLEADRRLERTCGAPFRAGVDATAIRAARQVRAAEVAARTAALAATRITDERRVVAGVLLAAGVLLLGAYALGW
jgi:hypothetical protein